MAALAADSADARAFAPPAKQALHYQLNGMRVIRRLVNVSPTLARSKAGKPVRF